MLPLLSRLNQYGLQAYIKAAGASAETQTGDAFGKAVATDGDTLAVGAPSQASSTGAVYLYTRAGEGGQWAPAVVLKAPNARSTDYFGQALAVHDDLVAVGAHGDCEQRTCKVSLTHRVWCVSTGAKVLCLQAVRCMCVCVECAGW